jgi:lysophospholipase L1-like esterase
VELRVLAVPGSKAGDVLRDQAPKLGGDDLVVLSVGANDVASRTSRRRYARELDAILMAAAPTPTVVMSMPDITMADRIGQPLRWLAGLRADYFDAARRRVVDRHPHAVSVDVATMPADLSRAAGRELLCADRFHPGPQVYRIWADRIAAAAHHLLHPVEGAAAVDPVTGVVPAPVLTR